MQRAHFVLFLLRKETTAQRITHMMQVGEDFCERPQAGCLMIGDGMRSTKGSHHGLRFLQFVASHAGKQMVFNLIVQSSIPKVGQGVGLHVASGQHLAMKEIPCILFLKDWHAFMIGRKNGPKIQSGQRLMNAYKKESLPEPQTPDDEGEVGRKVSEKQEPFEDIVPGLLAQ